MACISCGRGIIGECDCATGEESLNETTDDSSPVADFKRAPGRPQKENAELIDPSSTGRKRAAQLYPLDPEAWCEWKDRANCGGGKYPILGCSNGKQRNIHHGPDKETTNNSRHNIHLICPDCHNRWHAANDGDHDKNIPHAPRDASFVERQQRMSEEFIKEMKGKKK